MHAALFNTIINIWLETGNSPFPQHLSLYHSFFLWIPASCVYILSLQLNMFACENFCGQSVTASFKRSSVVGMRVHSIAVHQGMQNTVIRVPFGDSEKLVSWYILHQTPALSRVAHLSNSSVLIGFHQDTTYRGLFYYVGLHFVLFLIYFFF